MFDKNYPKPFHYSGSPSVFLDIDTLVYIVVLSLMAWLVVRLVQKRRSKKACDYLKFARKYILVCAITIFLVYLIQLLILGKMVLSNWIICFLPLLYGIIIQLILFFISKTDYRKVNKKYVIPIIIIIAGLIWYHLPINLSYQYAAMDSNGHNVKIDFSGKVYKNIFLGNRKDMILSIESSVIKTIPLKIEESQFVSEDNQDFYYQTDTLSGVTYNLKISSNQSVIEYEEYNSAGYRYSLYKTGRWFE